MKKYIFILSAFVAAIVLPGCEKEFNGLVESGESIYKITDVNSFSEVNYGLQDSTIQLWIQLKNDNDVTSVICEILDPDGDELKGSPVNLAKSEGKYASVYTVSYADIVGLYTINYFITDAASGTKLAASHYFNYDNGQANVAPVVSNLVALDTVALDPEDSTYISLTLDVTDENGLNDIKSVFFNSYKPDGTITGASPILLFDDGKFSEHGDMTANDGSYSRIVVMPPTGVVKGTYRWEFQAIDRRGLLSEKIIHNLVVK
jgi:hypothetical protein